MILVVLGTQELPFTRLLNDVNQMVEAGDINEKVIVQNGHTPAQAFQHLDAQAFFSYDEMDKLYDEAKLIISHGGTGSIITGVKKQKPVIAVPRRHEHGEHNDNHQLEIVEQFVSTGHVIGSGDLHQDVQTANEGFTPAPFTSGRDHIADMIRTFIQNKA
ncbi:glycosyltransferase [Geomicrobium sp. JCM 19039]|uniref:glycosyltransferase n=1 Tax=Geomicrobium sp. JCM 19039 TaxID=1460636 RepID=UPI0005AACA5B|nr:glycosyltransferase [Geomicrobium sp. JCM 19039]